METLHLLIISLAINCFSAIRWIMKYYGISFRLIKKTKEIKSIKQKAIVISKDKEISIKKKKKRRLSNRVIAIMIDGIKYESIASAAEKLDKPYSTIHQRLYQSYYPTYTLADGTKPDPMYDRTGTGKTAVKINGIEYESIRQAVKDINNKNGGSREKISYYNIYCRLFNRDFKNYTLIDGTKPKRYLRENKK